MIASVSFVLTGNLISNFPQTGEISNFSDNMSENTPSMRHFDAILASSPGTFDLKATFAGYEG